LNSLYEKFIISPNSKSNGTCSLTRVKSGAEKKLRGQGKCQPVNVNLMGLTYLKFLERL